MIDISNLTNLITALRAETAKDAISPDSLGALLQKIADVIATAAQSSEVTGIANWKVALAAITSCILNIEQNMSDSISVPLKLGRSLI